jgi:hypothetical protein
MRGGEGEIATVELATAETAPSLTLRTSRAMTDEGESDCSSIGSGNRGQRYMSCDGRLLST